MRSERDGTGDNLFVFTVNGCIFCCHPARSLPWRSQIDGRAVRADRSQIVASARAFKSYVVRACSFSQKNKSSAIRIVSYWTQPIKNPLVRRYGKFRLFLVHRRPARCSHAKHGRSTLYCLSMTRDRKTHVYVHARGRNSCFTSRRHRSDTFHTRFSARDRAHLPQRARAHLSRAAERSRRKTECPDERRTGCARA